MDLLNSCFHKDLGKLWNKNLISCSLTLPARLGSGWDRSAEATQPCPTLPSLADGGRVLQRDWHHINTSRCIFPSL